MTSPRRLSDGSTRLELEVLRRRQSVQNLCDKRFRAMGLNEYTVVKIHKVELGIFRDENLAAEEVMRVERLYTGAT